MVGFFEKILRSEEGSVRVGSGPEKIVEKENVAGLINIFLKNLEDEENVININAVAGKNAAEELREDIKIAKDLLEKTGLLTGSHSDGKEILRNINATFNVFLLKAKEKGPEKYADVIKEGYENLRILFSLILDCSEFREKEFSAVGGYLTEEENIDKETSMRLRVDKYLRKCEEKRRLTNN
jgi:hypothetical protein